MEDCTFNILHKVIRRRTVANSVVCTEGHTSYNSLREKIPEIVVEHHVVIYSKKNYKCRHDMTTNNNKGVWSKLKSFVASYCTEAHLAKKTILFSFFEHENNFREQKFEEFLTLIYFNIIVL